MGNLRKLGKIHWTQETSLSFVWQNWMELNGFSTESQAAQALSSLGIRGSDNISRWLQNEPTNSLLTSAYKTIIEKTGVDIDGWLVCEAKRMVLKDHPELASRISFERMTSRKDVAEELRTWSTLYGGTHYLALQMRIPSGQTNHYVQGTHQPSLEFLPHIIRTIAQGFVSIDCQEDIIFIMMCRAILGCNPQDFFPGITSFKQAVDELFKPFKGYQDKKVESETGIHYSTIHDLRVWKPVLGKRGLGPESIEKILRVLVIRNYPDLSKAFETNRSIYKKEETKGVWEVSIPLMDLLKANQKPLIETGKEKTSHTPRVKKLEVVEAERVIEHAADLLTETEDLHDPNLRNDLANLFTEFGARLRAPIKPIPVHYDARDVGATIQGVHNCLDQSKWTRRKGTRLTTVEIEKTRLAVEQLRAIFVGIAELDPDYIRTTLAPIFGPELFELFIAGESLKHLLETHGAWQVIAATRETAQMLRQQG